MGDERQLGDGDSLMINEDQEKQDEDKQFDEFVPEKQSGSLDIQGSEYFTKYPKAIANPQEKSLKLFKNAEGLPEGWKVRLLNDPIARRARKELARREKVLTFPIARSSRTWLLLPPWSEQQCLSVLVSSFLWQGASAS